MLAALAIVAALGPANIQREGTLLAEIPADLEVCGDLIPTSSRATFKPRDAIAWSADGQRVAYSAQRGGRGGKVVPVVNNEVGEPYDDVDRPYLAGGHAIFLVMNMLTESHYEYRLWIDGEALDDVEDRIECVAVDADGKQIAYWTHPGARHGNSEQSKSFDQFFTLAQEKRAGRWTVSRAKDAYWSEALVSPLFSQDGRKVFSFAIKPSRGWVVVQRSGKRVKELTDVSATIVNLAISPDGSAFAYTRQESAGQAPELFFRKKSVARTHPDQYVLAVGPESKQVAYVAKAGDRATAAIGSEEEWPHSYDHVLELAFAPDGSRLAFVANVGGSASVDTKGSVVGGRAFAVVRPTSGDDEWNEEARFLEVRDLVWSPDGTRLAYGARTDAGWLVVCGGARSAPFDDIGPPVFAPDGASIGFGARKGRELWWKHLPLD